MPVVSEQMDGWIDGFSGCCLKDFIDLLVLLQTEKAQNMNKTKSMYTGKPKRIRFLELAVQLC